MIFTLNPDPRPFRFKKFEIHQHQCAMKVGTDGVLLGAYTEPVEAENILDIGCGTGLLSLMLAQKSKAKITAVEIDRIAAKQAQYNFSISPWSDRIEVIGSSIQAFHPKTSKRFDLIISNPPYFNSKKKNDAREIARNRSALSYEELIHCSAELLSKVGTFAVIVPFQDQDAFVSLCEKHELFPKECCALKGNLQAEAKRCLLYFSKTKSECRYGSLTIEKEQRHDYTEEYLKLVAPYLL